MSASPVPRPTPRFEFSGGDLALDFANTWGDRARPESDGLTDFAALAAFVDQAGLSSDGGPDPLRAASAEDAAAAAAAWGAARELRESLFEIFAGAARRRPMSELAPALERVNDWLRLVLPDRRLEPRDGAVAWAWRRQPTALGELLAPLRPVVLSAAELVTSPLLARVRECDSASCSWLFLDRSRAGSRRWCSMQSCGNRAKARRHYRRHAPRAAD